MEKNHNSLKSNRRRKTLRDTSLTCDTNKFGSKKKRLCLKCGQIVYSKRLYKRIYEECSLIIDEIAFTRTFCKFKTSR